MKTLSLVLALSLTAPIAFGQGQVLFANRGANVDAPVMGIDFRGPGPNFSAQLLLTGDNGSLTPLVPISTFQPPGLGGAAIADRYWLPQTVEVPGVEPGSTATFVVRAWQTSLGTFETAFQQGLAGQSLPFTVTVGGGVLPAAPLATLQAFTLVLPEPSTSALALLAAALAIVWFAIKR